MGPCLPFLALQAALAAGERFFMFEGRNVAINKGLAMFITMNPMYEFRNVLPSNLKVCGGEEQKRNNKSTIALGRKESWSYISYSDRSSPIFPY